jgi:hypothetical protein
MEPSRHHRHKELNKERDQFLMVRQILNIIFMIGAVIGVIIFLTGNSTTGTIVILASMVFKIAECGFRFFG